ncbi:MAG: SRPBCC domain-containing protein [Xanthobacteraceae bacterium]
MPAQAKSTGFVTSRVFDAPRDLVWQSFTDPERMKEWVGPKGLHHRHLQNGFADRRDLSQEAGSPEETMNSTNQTKPFAEREVTITRVFDAPRAVVFQAWTDAARLAQWWGPKGFTNPVCEIDARVGGKLRIHMRAPDGNIYPMKGEIREFVLPERLAFTNIALDEAGNHVLEGFTTVTFADEGGKTRLTLHTRARAVVDKAAAYLEGMEMGWTMSIDKLEALLSTPSALH